MRLRSTAATALVAATAIAASLSTTPASAASEPRQILAAIPAWATPAAHQGAVSATTSIDGRVYLASRDAVGLAAFVDAVSDPDNAQFHQYLSAADAAARFGAMPEAPDEVASWLSSTGLTVTGSNKHYVAFTGTAETVGAAFGTSIDSYAVDGQTAFAPASAVSVPATIAADVLTVTGLSTQLVVNKPLLVDSEPAIAEEQVVPSGDQVSTPCSDFEGQKMADKYPKAYGETQPYAICGYEPHQLRKAYGVTQTGLTGKGITVAVVDAYALPTMKEDLDTWTEARDEQPFKKGQYKEYVPAGTGYDAGWAGEEALDIEAIHGIAPDADVVYVAAKTPYDSSFMDAFDTIIDDHLADAVNNSWGGGSDEQTSPATIAAFENQFQMGAAEGIGFYFSSGDSGGLAGGEPIVMYPSIDPYVTSVGGSAIGIGRKDGYQWETSWETDYSSLSDDGDSWEPRPPGDYASGAGGGTSVVFEQPRWQKDVVPAQFSEANGRTPMRTVPDIGADADPTTGFLEGYSTKVGNDWVYAENRIGGTSLAAPLIVGMQAIAEEKAGGEAIGFANPAIYKIFGGKAYNDVTDHPLGKDVMIAHVRTRTVGSDTVVSLATAGQAPDGGLKSIKGYDTTTGVGTPTKKYYKKLLK